MVIRYAVAMGFLAVPASASFLHGNVAGDAQFAAGPIAALPDSLALTAHFLDYKASPDLPQISNDLGAYSLTISAVALPGPSPSNDTRAYRVSGEVWHNGVLAERLLPKPAELTVDPVTGSSRLFLTLDFGRPVALPPTDFRPANGFALDGQVATSGANAGTFSGRLITATTVIPEPSTLALFGLGAVALSRARRLR